MLTCDMPFRASTRASFCGAVLFTLALWLATAAHAWGSKGHEMSARVAAHSVPKDMPEFFRQAAERLAYLCPEPDRWFTQSSAALGRINSPDHYFDLERWGPGPVPATRYELVFAAEKKNILREGNVGDLGTAPVAVAELAGNSDKCLARSRNAVMGSSGHLP